MELPDYLRLAREFEELIQNEPPHLRLGKTLEFVRDNFKPEDVFVSVKKPTPTDPDDEMWYKLTQRVSV